MSSLTPNDTRGLMESYAAVYDPDIRENLEQEQSEIEELGLEIIENAAYVLFSQGYDVDDVISYFTEATENTIIEDYVNFVEGKLIVESVAVSDEYIAEQFEILNERIGGLIRGAAGLVGKGLQKAGQFLSNKSIPKQGKQLSLPLGQAGKPNLLQRAASGAKELVKKIPGAGTVSKLAKGPVGKVVGRAAPGVGAALYGMDAANRAKKGDWGGAALSGAGAALSLAPGVGTLASLAPAGVQMATDAMGLTGDKSRKGPSTKTQPAGAPKPAGGAGMVNVPGKGQRYYASSDKKYYKNYNDALAARRSRRGETAPTAKTTPAAAAPEVKATNTIAAKPSQPEVKPAKSAAPAKPAIGKLGGTTFERRTPTSAEFKGAQAARASGEKNPEKVLQAAQAAGKVQSSVDADVKKANTPAELNKSAPAGSALAAEQERRRKAQQAATTSESYDAFDLVLDYLTSQGHVETLDEALYVMMEMDAETIGTIVEAAADQSNKQIEKGIKTTYKAGNVIDNQHQGRSRGLSRLPAGERAAKTKRMRERLNARRADLFGERRNREDAAREEMKKKYGL